MLATWDPLLVGVVIQNNLPIIFVACLAAVSMWDPAVHSFPSFLSLLITDKCQEVVILITIYDTFITCFASYSGKS